MKLSLDYLSKNEYSKKLGQNFLNSKSIAKFIVDSATISKNNTVYEIGIGKGILTPYLCEQSKNVISVEKDLNPVSYTHLTLPTILLV